MDELTTAFDAEKAGQLRTTLRKMLDAILSAARNAY